MTKVTITRDLAFVAVGATGAVYQLFWVDPVNRGWMLFFIMLLALPSFFHNDDIIVANKTIQKYLYDLGIQNERERLEKEKRELRARLKRIEESLGDE